MFDSNFNVRFLLISTEYTCALADNLTGRVIVENSRDSLPATTTTNFCSLNLSNLKKNI